MFAAPQPKGLTVDTNVIGRRRTVPLAVLMLVGLLAALLTTVVPGEDADAAEHGGQQAAVSRTASQNAFHDQMRKLWEDHVTWTRMAIVTFADGSSSFDATAARLLQNQTDIGDAVKPFYGDAAGTQLTALLHDHITIAVELLQAARAGDTVAFDDANTRWYANADDIADFLSSANPRSWPREVMRADMTMHLDQTLAEASHELMADYPASVRDYEAIHLHILDMADMLSSGIMQQFAQRFR
jgi:hypothetical protein